MDEIYRLVVLLPATPTKDMCSMVIFHPSPSAFASRGSQSLSQLPAGQRWGTS